MGEPGLAVSAIGSHGIEDEDPRQPEREAESPRLFRFGVGLRSHAHAEPRAHPDQLLGHRGAQS
ncbi:hypothetical protein DB30_07005 [Enhygromyxa salina]|uniref:Uncharacterized protein n=1 Tax=Enhygromyxa salina TaxID=215803 RepID=A0A0C2CSW3_9BACT|nr:hypothetical protein DB30_07005 [Enhygromyxa salina]